MSLYKKTEGMLYNYRNLKAEIKNIDLEIEELKNNYEGVTGVSYEERTGPTHKFNSSVENEIVNKEKKIEYLLNVKRYKEIQIEKIDNALESLCERDRNIIELRYFHKITNRDLSSRLDLSEQRISSIKTEVINNIISLIFV